MLDGCFKDFSEVFPFVTYLVEFLTVLGFGEFEDFVCDGDVVVEAEFCGFFSEEVSEHGNFGFVALEPHAGA